MGRNFKNSFKLHQRLQIAPSLQIAPVFRAGIVVQFGRDYCIRRNQINPRINLKPNIIYLYNHFEDLKSKKKTKNIVRLKDIFGEFLNFLIYFPLHVSWFDNILHLSDVFEFYFKNWVLGKIISRARKITGQAVSILARTNVKYYSYSNVHLTLAEK